MSGEYSTRVQDPSGRWVRLSPFPDSWGRPPTPYDSPARRAWIAQHAMEHGALFGDASSARALLESKREDPATARERARAATANRLRRQRLLDLLRTCP